MSCPAMLFAVGAAVLAAVLGLVWIRRRMLVVAVEGDSMEPTLRAGERVLVRRAPATAVPPGRLVVLATAWVDFRGRSDGIDHARFMIKRLVAVPGGPVPEALRGVVAEDVSGTVPPGSILVLGDNPAVSADSRQAGYLPASDLVGVVVRRLRR